MGVQRSMAWVLLGCVSCSPQVVNAVDDLPKDAASVDSGKPDSEVSDADTEAGGGSESGASGSGPGGTGSTGGAGGSGGDAPGPTLRGDALLHRYSFSGSGTQALDAKGAAHGALVGAQLSNTGAANLNGTPMANQYVDLPDGLISGLYNATFEAWVDWQGGLDWQRIFDFGEDETGMEDARSSGRSYLFLSPHGDEDFLRAVYRRPGSKEIVVDVKPALPVGAASYVALVFDGTHDSMLLYVNGALGGSVSPVGKLSQIHDVNDWLGRSQFSIDAPYTGTIDEFRIYDAALSAAEIKKSFDTGPDVVFPAP